MTTYKGFNQHAFERNAHTTLAQHIREVEKEMLRNFQFLALMDSAGRVTYNHAGEGFDWPVQFRLHNLEGNTGETARRWERVNLWQTAALDYRGYQATDMMYEREFLSNRGPEGIIRVFDGMVTRLEESMRQGLGSQFFLNGDLAQNAEFWQGFETMFAATQTLNNGDGTARTANQADFVAWPDTTYATLSTVLGNYGGDNESGAIWPEGLADPEYDFWTPLIVLWNSTSFSGATQSFQDQGEEAMRYAMLAQQRNGSLEDRLTTYWLARNLYRDFLAKQDNRQEIVVQSGYTVRALGFQSVMFDGVEVTWEPSVPTDVGYGMALMSTELRSMYPGLIESEGPEYSMDDQAYRAVVKTISNFKFKSPRNFVKLTKHDNL